MIHDWGEVKSASYRSNSVEKSNYIGEALVTRSWRLVSYPDKGNTEGSWARSAMSHSNKANSLKHIPLAAHEKELVEAFLLGDGTLSKSGRYYRLRVEHMSQDRDYVLWKYQQIKHLCISNIRYVPSHDSYRFGTVGHPALSLMRDKWYCPQKEVPDSFELTPFKLSIWFMDDGTRHRDTVDISVHSFSKRSLCLLREQLSSFRITTTVNSDAKGNRLYILKKSYKRFEELTKPYSLTCMARKWP
jgi:hypothetical protein